MKGKSKAVSTEKPMKAARAVPSTAAPSNGAHLETFKEPQKTAINWTLYPQAEPKKSPVIKSALYTKKQLELLQLWRNNKLRRLNILEGSVRSGKTWISLVLWAFWICSMPGDKGYLMCANTLQTLKRNCLDPLASLVGEKNFTYSITLKEGCLFGRKLYFEGAFDAASETKIRGLTLAGAYCDELTLFNEDFFAMLLSRISEPGAKLFATTNPDNPSHWLMKKYLSKESSLDMMIMKFLIDDNHFLNKEYIDNLKKEYTGVYYQRFILGKWVAAEGAVYRIFSDNKPKFLITGEPVNVSFSHIGVDFGGSGSAHAFVLNGFTSDLSRVITLDEWYFKGSLTPTALEASFVEFVKRNERYNPITAYCDSAEQVLISGLRNACINAGLLIGVTNARKGPILERIRFYNLLHNKGAYQIMEHCTHLIEAFETAVYDPKSMTDLRLDNGATNIDSLDAAEYATESLQKTIISQIGYESKGDENT